ncbi:MAG: hypothetical protein JWM91_2339 [Rhodospirillales bacterium]|nr:hypothetical protein [Rhodospirillales bacterium]
MQDMNHIIGGWVQERENLDRSIVVVKLRGVASSVELAALIKCRSDVNDRIIQISRVG